MKIKFLIAEEIRSEGSESGKVTILGLFPDDNILILDPASQGNTDPNEKIGIEKLVILINASNLPEKKCKFKVKFIDPSGEEYRSAIELGETETQKGTSQTFIIKLQPFLIKEFGVYTCVFYVDKKPFKFPFSVTEKTNT